MEMHKGIPCVAAESVEAWRIWLENNHEDHSGIWLIIHHKGSDHKSVYYDEAVDAALCYGWVDSKPNKRDDTSYYQFFSPRNPKSNWSKINKEKVKLLSEAGLMTAAGLRMVATAKANGTWDALNDVEAGVIPHDLNEALDSFPNARKHFEEFPKSVKRGILEWIFNAKRPETRAKRILDTASKAEKNIRANQFRS